MPEGILAGLRPLDLEIGCGVGLHPVRRAQAFPERNLIAIEHTSEKYAKFESRLRGNDPLLNLFPVHANAVTWVDEYLPHLILDSVFFMYPNPNQKNKAKRWIRMPFMQRLLESVKVGGEISFATNIDWYADELREWGVGAWKLEIISDRKFTLQDLEKTNQKARTHFEKKYLERGEFCFEIIFRKRV